MKTVKLSDLKPEQWFKLATSDNCCIFISAEIKPNQVRVSYTYRCINSGNEISTYNNYEVFI